ncbi:hypothetical protein PRZ48_001861 [Zasmidium cellare]|uniref:tRNA(Phe) 7-[(3-amino-3-carboxypropyl)-4-demethylwyosine(37)-N(4)]-methyltransferase n=1 Tax=Zasmidium cellare TaxID=395010 RepID=A0ABR0F4A2_ZASCE|nr:hypothetical protein PRZ48_001861 [Zasmidium cellare]
MPSKFDEKKAKILAQLSAPEEAYSDLSPKGSVDRGVRELCAEINALDGFVTTSSCAGRMAVYLEGGQQKILPDEEIDDATNAATASAGGGKGGGEWLYVSHDPFEMSSVDATTGGLTTLFGMDASTKPSTPSNLTGIRFVHFRFEPMILHVLTSSLQHAQTAHSAGLAAGFRETGISSIAGSDPTPIVAVRTQGLFLSSIIGYQETSQGTPPTIKPMVTEEYLSTLVRLANRRFAANEERKERFQRALPKPEQTSLDVSKASSTWEPAEERKQRKRAEGLRIREELRQRGEAAAAAKSEPRETSRERIDGEEEDYYAVGLDLEPDVRPP